MLNAIKTMKSVKYNRKCLSPLTFILCLLKKKKKKRGGRGERIFSLDHLNTSYLNTAALTKTLCLEWKPSPTPFSG